MSSALLTLAGSGGGSQGVSLLETTTYSGDSVNNRAFNVGHPTSMVINKMLNPPTTQQWCLNDIVRGAGAVLYPDSTQTESSLPNTIREFTSTGFKTGSSSLTNESPYNYVAYSFSTNSTASSNTEGTITANVNAGVANGFSICTYTGNGTSGSTYGHGLDSTPELVITKARTDSHPWVVTGAEIGLNNYLRLEVSSGTSAYIQPLPGSSVINLSNLFPTNELNTDYVSFCFHSVTGKSKIGKYTGTGTSPGVTINTGFRPGFVLIKGINTSVGWYIFDSKQNTSNPRTTYLAFEDAGGTQTLTGGVDFNATSFDVNPSTLNLGGRTYLYFAIAEES